MTAYLTNAEILLLHARLIQRTGGSGGVRDMGLLESALARPQATFDGIMLYPTLAEQAAALLESLVRNHAFMDGNKRVGLVAAGLFLERNGYRLTADNAAVFTLTMQVARGELSHAAIARWLEEHICPISALNSE